MNKQILAVTVVIALAAAVLTPTLSSNNQAFAQVTAESRVLQAILGLTDQIKQQTTEIKGKYDDTIFDLDFKKKFYSFNSTVTEVNALGIFIADCDLPPEACSFNVESIQLDSTGFADRPVNALVVDTVTTDISDKDITTPTNLLVDTGIGRIGASEFVVVIINIQPIDGFTGDVEFNGEKPQKMSLLAGLAEGSSEEGTDVTCMDGQGNEVECPYWFEHAVAEALDDYY